MTLYVANTYGEHVLAYQVKSDGSVTGRRNFAKLDGVTKTDTGVTSGADGLAVDSKGRLYVASTSGVQVFDARGAALGVIALPKAPQNLAFAGDGKKTLYVVGRGAAYRIAVLTPGYGGRAKLKNAVDDRVAVHQNRTATRLMRQPILCQMRL